MEKENVLSKEIKYDIVKNKKFDRFLKIQKTIYSKIEKCKSNKNISEIFKIEIKQLDELGVLKYSNAELFIQSMVNSYFKTKNNSDKLESIYTYIPAKLETDLLNEREKLIQDRIFLYSYFKSRKNQINNMDLSDVKTLFELDMDLVKQNENMYPILFNYFDYIKAEILNKYESSKVKTENKEVFQFISDLTLKPIKWTAIKKYYYDKFLDLIAE